MTNAGTMVPSELDTTLPYFAIFNLTSAATLVSTKYLNANGAYDVDPALGSSATQGFTEMIAFFNYYRVVGYDYEIEVNNENNIPIIFTILNSNTTLGVGTGIGTSFDLSPYSNNPLSQSKLMGHAYNTSSTHVFRGRHTVAQIAGTMATETEDNWRGTYTANPADLVYIIMGVTSAAQGVNFITNNVNVVVRLFMNIRFFDRKPLSG
jgi:hypothetical protein